MFRSIGFACAALLLVPADGHAQTATTGTVAGVVVARDTAQPVAGATVTLRGSSRTAIAGPGGRFRLDDVSSGTATLLVHADGFVDLTVPDVRVAPNAITSLVVELPVSANVLERVQVTADKMAQTLGEVAAQVDIIDRATIDARADQTLAQALSAVPGAVMSTQLGIFDSVTLRGLPRGDPEFTTTLLLIDGVPQTLSNNGARIVALPINDASQIEVMRGPNSAVYGRTAIGGSVNVHTASPTPKHEVGVDLAGGEFATTRGGLHASGPIGTWGGYYVSGEGARHGGYFDNLTTDQFSVGHWAGFGKLTFAPDARSYGSVSVNRVVSTNSTPTNEPVIDGQFLHEIEPGFDRLTNFNIPGPNYRQGETRLTLNYSRQFSDSLEGTEIFGYRHVNHHFIDDGDFIGSPYDLENHTLVMYPFDQELAEQIAYQEFRVEWKPRRAGWKQSLLAGGSYEWDQGNIASDFIYTDEDLFGFPIDYLNPVIPDESEWQHDKSSRSYGLGIGGLFAQYAIEPTSRLRLSGGGRYDRLAMDATRGGTTADLTFSAFSPKASATMRVLGGASGDSLSVYGTYAQAFLPPRRPSSLIPADVPLNLEPEDITNYEAGMKASLWQGRARLEATVFRMTETGVVLTTRQGPFFVPTNSGEISYKGVETGAAVAVTPRVSLMANAAFYRNRFGDFVIESEDGDEVLTGLRLPIAPDYVINWGATVRPAPTLEFNATVKHVGSVQTNRSNTFELDGYGIVDLAGSWHRGAMRVTVAAENLFNHDYYWNSDGDTADPARPRQLLVTTSIRLR